MSDGNFNRSLLPSHSYSSGVRAGRAQMKHMALEAFASWSAQRFPELSAEERQTLLLEFKQILD